MVGGIETSKVSLLAESELNALHHRVAGLLEAAKLEIHGRERARHVGAAYADDDFPSEHDHVSGFCKKWFQHARPCAARARGIGIAPTSRSNRQLAGFGCHGSSSSPDNSNSARLKDSQNENEEPDFTKPCNRQC
jgi:hypothetical protein